jgi:hypothetical protein
MYNTNAGITTESNGRYQNNGSYTTANSVTSAQSLGFGLAQFEYGLPNSSAITINSNLASRSNYMAEWLQDDWKATPRLTVNLGVRFEFEGPNSERNQKANTYFDFNTVNPAAAAQANYSAIAPTNPALISAANWKVNGGLRFVGDSTTSLNGRQTYHTSIINVLPRQPLSFNPSSTLPVFLGSNPASSAWGRSGYRKSVVGSNAGLWFNPANWALSTSKATSGQISGVYGNQYQIRTLPVRFDGLRADFMNQFDGAVQRNFSLSRVYEPLTLQFRADVINVFNHPVYGGSGTNHTPVTDWTSSTFGEVTAQENQPRIYQFEAFLRF